MRITRYVLAALSVESMRSIAENGCRQSPGYRRGVLQMLERFVLDVGVTDSELVNKSDDGIIELGRVGPEVAVLELELSDGQVVRTELHGEVCLCHISDRSKVRTPLGRAYDSSGRLLREGRM